MRDCLESSQLGGKSEWQTDKPMRTQRNEAKVLREMRREMALSEWPERNESLPLPPSC